ncbi:hypothetical protein [Bacillus marinisedimentorum]|uniref:hypothetical protein n=1 Tax=Bacillus marinisedimentorum TaxID=1821260 RepID=UPI0008721F22|nr:hypothetical protein [Bacillus marinisedimentorum]
MGEEYLEKRLERLKKSYRSMPSVTSSDSIMDHIKEKEKPPKPKRNWSAWTAAASFIGVLLIAGVLAAQMLSGGMDERAENAPESNMPQESKVENNPSADGETNRDGEYSLTGDSSAVTEEDKEEALERLETLYERELTNLAEQLDTDVMLEQFVFVQKAKSELTYFSETGFKTKEDMAAAFNAAADRISWQLSTPAQALNELKEKQGSMSQGEFEASFADLLSKQEELQKLTLERFKEKSKLKVLSKAVVDSLNRGVHPENKAAGAEAQFVLDNGYRFVMDSEGMLQLEIDYPKHIKLFGDRLPEALNAYIDLQPALEWASDAYVLGGWDKLSERITETELFLLQHPNFDKSVEIYQEYKYMVNAYLFGIDNSPAFNEEGFLKHDVKASFERFMKVHRDTETYPIVKSYYELLKKHDFKRTDAVAGYTVNWPELVNGKDSSTDFYGKKPLQLSGELPSIYDGLKGAESAEQVNGLLKDLSPYDVMKLYIEAGQNSDADTQYKLLLQDDGTPSQEVFMEELEAAEDYRKLISEIHTVRAEKSDEKTMVFTFEGQYADVKRVFTTVRNEQGVWRIPYQPMEVINVGSP